MKFIAVTTGYGKSAGSAGFSGKPVTRSAEEHAEALIGLFDRCRKAVWGRMRHPAPSRLTLLSAFLGRFLRGRLLGGSFLRRSLLRDLLRGTLLRRGFLRRGLLGGLLTAFFTGAFLAAFLTGAFLAAFFAGAFFGGRLLRGRFLHGRGLLDGLLQRLPDGSDRLGLRSVLIGRRVRHRRAVLGVSDSPRRPRLPRPRRNRRA